MDEGNNNDQGGGDRQIFTEVNFLHGRYPHQVEDSVAWRD
ncbi:putative cation/multidrug efflux pump [Klebsiella pneumoniae subsp. pneumoniae CIP 52.145 = B5055]|nr:putative cation/multidrug efflux pump [Klebsiella pneumoniae subsp. pneumoniae CIP 52.145 = B5055]